MSTPFRFILRYDPVFLEIGRRLASREWGILNGVSVFAALPSADAERELLAFLMLLFGIPKSAARTFSSSLSRSFFMYGSFALSAECTVIGELPGAPRTSAVSGSLACSEGVVEFRLGADRVLSFARGEKRAVRASLAEGDGERYRAMDEASPGGPGVVPPAADQDALLAAERLLASGALA